MNNVSNQNYERIVKYEIEFIRENLETLEKCLPITNLKDNYKLNEFLDYLKRVKNSTHRIYSSIIDDLNNYNNKGEV